MFQPATFARAAVLQLPTSGGHFQGSLTKNKKGHRHRAFDEREARKRNDQTASELEHTLGGARVRRLSFPRKMFRPRSVRGREVEPLRTSEYKRFRRALEERSISGVPGGDSLAGIFSPRQGCFERDFPQFLLTPQLISCSYRE